MQTPESVAKKVKKREEERARQQARKDQQRMGEEIHQLHAELAQTKAMVSRLLDMHTNGPPAEPAARPEDPVEQHDEPEVEEADYGGDEPSEREEEPSGYPKVILVSIGVDHERPVWTQDVRAFHDPRAGVLAKHTGFHPDIQGRILKQKPEVFNQLVQETFEAIEQHRGHEVIELGFMCQSGRHRSVAIVQLMRWLLVQAGRTVTSEHRGIAAGACCRAGPNYSWCQQCRDCEPDLACQQQLRRILRARSQ